MDIKIQDSIFKIKNEPETQNSKPTLTPVLSQGERGKVQGDLKKATKEFEAFFLSYMLKTMRESVPKDGLLSGGKGEEIYTSMLDEALSKEMADRGGIGIGELMLKQMEPKQVQEADKSPLTPLFQRGEKISPPLEKGD